MNDNLLSYIKRRIKLNEKDMFSRTQRRLTVVYSGLLIVFLMLFILVVYNILYFSIKQSAERELRSLAALEANYVEIYLLANKPNDFRSIPSQEIVFTGVNQVFYYVLNRKGEIVMGNEGESRVKSAVYPLLVDHLSNSQGIFYESIHLEEKREERGYRGRFFRPEPARNLDIMIASHPITYKGKVIGQLFLGKDFTFALQLFRWVLFVLVGLGIIFFGVAILISHRMSQKAMVPISNAFTRQREFVADASHELRTPLAVLQSSVDAMEMTVEPEKGDFTEKLIGNMRQEVKRMTNLVSDLLTLARSDSNIVELRSEPFDFRPIAEKAIESVNALASEKEIRLSLSAPEKLLAVGDSERIAQLLYILLDNAIKYTLNGGTVKLMVMQEDAQLCIDVQDTGIGIPKEDLHHIFERFYRTEKSRTRQLGGHGLGLSIAKWIVDTHKGTIDVESEVGKGSIFRIRLPQ